MFRLSTSVMYDTSTRGMQDQQLKLFKTQMQLSSGQRLVSPADDPPAAARILDLTQAIDNTTQYKKNIAFARTRLSLEDQTLGGVTNLLQRMRELAVKASNATNTTIDRQTIAGEVRQGLGEILGLANTKDGNGDYLFAGFQGQASPAAFTDDGNGVYTYRGDQGHRTLTIADNRQMSDGDNGYDLFVNLPTTIDTDPTVNPGIDPSRSVFGTIYNFAAALDKITTNANPNPTVGDPLYVGHYITDIDAAMKRIDDVRTQVGGRLNAIDAQDQIHDSFNLAAQNARSQDQDLDYVEAISRFQFSQVALEAAQKTYTQVQGMSLFKYI
ncbi:MAG: flagellar hook-associated protein FlgL [Pseudomonadota bacterium]